MDGATCEVGSSGQQTAENVKLPTTCRESGPYTLQKGAAMPFPNCVGGNHGVVLGKREAAQGLWEHLVLRRNAKVVPPNIVEADSPGKPPGQDACASRGTNLSRRMHAG